MPSVGIHLIVADALMARMGKSADPLEQSLANAIAAYPYHYALGAIGPDLFYYLTFSTKVSAALADVFDALNSIGKALDDAAALASQAGMPNFANLVHSLATTTQIALGVLQSKLEAAIIRLNDLIVGEPIFGSSPIQAGDPETKWNWGDILHDRASGVYSQRITARAAAAGNSAWLAYATGYKTHLATDFVGHPYVNQVVGGPARAWNMRHTLAEKFMDAHAFMSRGGDINTSRLHRRIEPLLDTPELASLSQMLADELSALKSQWPDPLPDLADADDIQDAVEVMNSLFRLVTEGSFVPPPVAPSISIPPIPGQYGSLTGALGGSLSPPGGVPKTITDWLKLLLLFLLSLPAIMADLVRMAADLAAGIIAYPAEAALYVFQSMLYSQYRQLRWFLVISGLVFPYKDEIFSWLGRQFVTSPGNGDGYPRTPPSINAWVERWHALGRILEFEANDSPYLHFPTTAPETPGTHAAPYPRGVSPEYFISQLAPDPAYFMQWIACTSTDELREIMPITPGSGSSQVAGFGNAVECSRMIIHNEPAFTNMNLDGDRGYAYRQWVCDSGLDSGHLVNERLKFT